MAGEERTEQATPRRRQEAREKGQVAKSIEVNAALGLLASLLAIKWLAGNAATCWQAFTVSHFAQAPLDQLTIPALQQQVLQASLTFARITGLPLLLILVTGVVTNVLQTGFIFSGQTLTPDFGRLNPLQGFTRMFSMRAGVDLVKSAVKAFVVGYTIYAFFHDRGTEIIRLCLMDFRVFGPQLFDLVWGLLLKCTVVLVVIAGLDYLYQRWHFEKTLRMTKQEIKEEFKRMEGDPLIKARTRQRQREFAQRRMMADVRTATVVVTNPTHFAVALRYEPGDMHAPKVVAKGQNLVAQRIKEIAREHRVPVIENKPLARSLYHTCEIGDFIPADLFQAVAEIIAFVFKQSGRAARYATQTGTH